MSFQSKLKTTQPRRVQFKKKIKLLSGGFVKPDSFPNGGEITVYPWDAEVDDWLANRGRKGDQTSVLYDLCAHLCDLNGCPIDSFVVGDVNTVLLVARAIRSNSVVEYEAQCPACNNLTEEEIAVPDELGRVGEKAPDYPGWDEIILPDVEDVVRIRPLQVKDEKIITSRDATLRQLVSDRVMHIILPVVSINGGSPDGWEPLSRWYNAISPSDATFLEEQEIKLFPHLDTNIPHVCDRCGKHFKHSLDFNAEFFRSRVKSKPGSTLADNVQPGVGQRGQIDAQPEGSAGHNAGEPGPVGKRES
jgi:hypothetical protein